MSPKNHPPKGHGQEAGSGGTGMVDARASSAAGRPDGPVDPTVGDSPMPASASAGLSVEQLQSELKAAREEAQATFAKYQRLAADFENYKRRTRQELADRTQYANEELLLRLLPLLDNFRRALEHVPEAIDQRWFEGVQLVARQFEATLEAQGLSSIPAVGEKFDPTQHEAIAHQETAEHEEGTVVEEMQPGYRLHEKVLRPTLVKVAQPPALEP